MATTRTLNVVNGRIQRVLVLSLILAASTFAAADAQQRGRGGDGRLTRVVVDAVREEPLVQTIPVLGRLVPRQAGVIAARIAGPVAEIHVQVGDRVEAGTTLAAIDSATLKWTRAMRAADVAEQGSSVAKAESELALAKQELARLESLRSSAAFSEARYNDKRRDVDRTASVVGEARAKLQSARANHNMAKTNLAYAVIKAPYPGVITHRYAEVGAYLKVGDSAFSMINDTNLEVEADVPVTRLAGIVPGGGLSIAFESGATTTAVVRAIIPDENPLARTQAVRFTPDLSGMAVRLAKNQSVTVRIPLGPPRDVVTVHKDAVLIRGGDRVVYAVEEGKAILRRVTLGDAVDGRFEVMDGLKPGDSVVVRGNERLRPNQKVEVAKPGSAKGGDKSGGKGGRQGS